jgi:asparagine synthase (glutamine-hydrolysing)
VRAVTGFDMPVFAKRRFQHGATRPDSLRRRVSASEAELRREFLALYHGA